MAKDSSFAAKVAKASGEPSGDQCPTCGEMLSVVKLVVSERSATRDSWKFNEKLVKVCKCNHAEVYG
ncbi:MAG: hypothetical protein E2O76_06430 [Caldithrix sp.]|nr:MAG: hypothetical protein E2O79_11315 [Caldithrix sp.]TDI99505.1 MAG: hypothetical protein E2O76_06430 [Caldithrix sp.]